MSGFLVTVRMTIDIEVEVEADTPSAAIHDATRKVEEDGHNAGEVLYVTTDTQRVQEADGALDADLDSYIDLRAAVGAAPGESWRWSIRPYLLRKTDATAPLASDLRWQEVLDALDEWATDHAPAVTL